MTAAHRNDACLIYWLLKVHNICQGEEDSKNGRTIFVIRRFSVSRFDATEKYLRLCGGCFYQTPFYAGGTNGIRAGGEYFL